MNLLKAAVRKLWFLVLVGGCSLAVEATAWAAKSHQQPVTEKSTATYWVFPYFIVILCIALGMLVVCRPSRRSERARPQKYEDLKTAD